jgi:hypothetical protein
VLVLGSMGKSRGVEVGCGRIFGVGGRYWEMCLGIRRWRMGGGRARRVLGVRTVVDVVAGIGLEKNDVGEGGCRSVQLRLR